LIIWLVTVLRMAKLAKIVVRSVDGDADV